jgi:large subunit ribosomal protein L35
MPKQKTRKAIAKRFRKTARGKVLSARPGKSHLLGHKSRKRKRHLRGTTRVSHQFEKSIRSMLG